MLLQEYDPNKDAVINPEMLVEKVENFPDVTISCFSKKLFESVLAFFEPKKIVEVRSAVGGNPIYEVEYKGERFAFFQSYVGEPKCVGDYEDILAMGSQCLILLGNCGVLDKTIEDCGIIIPTRAIRDEGCSYHYAPPSDMLDVNKKYVELFCQVLDQYGYPYVKGITWTTDACYRETRERWSVERHRAPSVSRWNVQECRHCATFAEAISSSFSTPEITSTTPSGSREAFQGRHVWTTRAKSHCWPLSWV